ncbi:type I-C CRISPR-associated protein Cas8c/Csd1 [Streptomyces sp. NPDC059426]|uniref:type I-C CRISPR-associated protein Cas8c/Csd1 n=1 Tax=Streptomyces sp. NPDC059426 TaxID=3346827 RepID=UPI00367502E8
MFLTRLAEYAAEHSDRLPPAFHLESGVLWMVDLDTEGRLATTDLQPIRDPADPAGRRGLPTVVPSVGRTSAVVPLLACDKIEYALGWTDPKKTDDAKAQARAVGYHQAFCDLAARWATDCPDDQIAQALHAFLASGDIARVTQPPKYAPTDLVAFRVEGQMAHTSATVRTYWPSIVQSRKSSGLHGHCLVGDHDGPLLKRMPRPLRPNLIPAVGYDPDSKSERKQTQGPALVSVNQTAHAFNLQTELAHIPICEDCAESTTAALEHLLKNRGQRRTIGDAALVWWIAPTPGTASRAEQPQGPVRLLFKPDPAKIAVMIDAPRKGTAIVTGTARTDMFCAATMSTNAGRVVVRDWIDIPLPEAEAHITNWFAHMQVIDPWTGQRRFFSIYRLLLALGRWQSGRKAHSGSYAPMGSSSARRPVWAQRELLQAALKGTPLSSSTLAHLLLRIRTDGRFDLPRQALIRLCLTRSHPNHAQELSMALDPEDPTPAYVAGRMFAVLEALQFAATRAGGSALNTTITDRYFSRAVTSPATVLVPALRNSKAHLKKLRTHNREKSAVFFARSLDELTGRLRPFPTHLALHDQGLWLNGYADQRNHDIARARERGLPTKELLPDTETTDDTTTKE